MQPVAHHATTSHHPEPSFYLIGILIITRKIFQQLLLEKELVEA